MVMEISSIFLFYILAVITCIIRNKWVIHAVIIGFAYLFSTRNDNVPDTENYINIFEDATWYILNGTGDIGFSLLNLVSHDFLHLTYPVFLFILTFLLMEFWLYSTKKLFPNGRYGVLFLLFISYFGFFYLGITIRNAIALILCNHAVVCYLCRDKKKILFFSIWVILATLFHKTSIIFFVLIPFLRMRIKPIILIFILLFSTTFAIFNNIPVVKTILETISSYTDGYDKYSEYTNDKVVTKFLTVTFLMELVISIAVIWGYYSVRLSKRSMYLYMTYSKFVLFGLVIHLALWTMPVVTRLSREFIFFSSVIFYLQLFHNQAKMGINTRYICTVLISLAYFVVLIYAESSILNY